MTDTRDLIRQLNEIGAIKTGSFTLKSGAMSPVYVDLRLLAGYPSTLRDVARAYADVATSLEFDVLAALPYAAMPIGTALSLHMNRPMVYPRKEKKGYGTDKVVEGVFRPGDVALVVDDVITDGGAKLEGIHLLEEAGLVIQDVLVLVDREAGGREALAAAGYRLHCMLTLAEILETLETSRPTPP
jgi:uridine monophosphate synthetase